jgi:hypothetical protein
MVCVDVTELNFNDVFDHVFGFFERFGEKIFHDFKDSSIQVFVSFDLRNFDAIDESSEFFVNKMSTLK